PRDLGDDRGYRVGVYILPRWGAACCAPTTDMPGVLAKWPRPPITELLCDALGILWRRTPASLRRARHSVVKDTELLAARGVLRPWDEGR
ncbi:MAG TPA: hypothetical protein VH022_01805, partial [Candidatus Acidoferrum sp.]|nr:hypothetical protein [Candidatus Acidoferrum sp.]